MTVTTERLWCKAGEHFYDRNLRRGPKPHSCLLHRPLALVARKARRPRQDLEHLWGPYLIAWEEWMKRDTLHDLDERDVAGELKDALLAELLEAANPATHDSLLDRDERGRHVPFRPTS